VVETFREHQISIPLPPIITDYKDYFYRNKMEYSLYWDNEESIIKPAFHHRGSHCKVPVVSSSIERPEIFQAAKNIIDDLNSRGDEARRYQSLLLRCNQKGEISGGLYKNNQPHQIFPNLKDSILKNEYSYSPNGFFQINLPVYEMVLLEIEKNITTDDVLDLYAGVGTIGLSVARERNLTLVEIDKFAFNELSKNCKQVFSKESKGYNNEHTNPKITGEEYLSRRKSPTPVLAKSEEALEYIKSNQTVILDPPRSGCDKKLIEKILEVRPQKIVYLSCNPVTQARDIKLLLSEYNIDTIKSYNFFPRTPHIENLVVLTEKAS
jgi:23S rRNA (uracil1939-C5)-methyltransferase